MIRIIEIKPSYSYEYFKEKINKLYFHTVTSKEIARIIEDIESDIECGNLTKNEKECLIALLIRKVLFNK